ncbi:undecaprenyl-phosphate glucose phosphotransferase [Thiomicrorhabdus immobilis]|uniref:Undecaprenyl-phosphate glucose phosphotransferase n=1 Tax=Thiomicrorhabdus immobilis TaxID=2791037 RepID=A0ABM7MBL0_9GAMM|nr:undecaprenyl-phosphate glucose phosphotransferase [Thiomicrorhabdus immobilis]BCN92704.1 undecaprenyl-phosphate glucose phosphotransferase [Thiomicrorhabdus immobilis]
MQIFPDRSIFVYLHRAIDLVLPFILLSLITLLFNTPFHERYQIMGASAGVLLLLTSQFTGVYTNWRGRSIFQSAKLIMQAWLITWAILIILAFWYKDTVNYSRLAVTTWAIFVMFILIAYRIAIRLALIYLRKSAQNHKKIAIIGAGKIGKQLAKNINENPWMGYKVTAFYDDNPKILNQKINDIPVIGSIEVVAEDTKNIKYDEIYICLPLGADLKIKHLLDELTDTTAIVKYVPDLFTFDLMHAKMQDIKGMPVFSVFDTPLSCNSSLVIKRLEDVLLSLLILILISPILLVISIAIKLTSSGPVIFKQKRYGLNGKEIEVYKFRSMTTQDNGSIVKQATKGDTRITPLGAFLRKTSLDELPQFINVLQGKMSIVGPRPHAIAHNEEYRKIIPKYMQRHLVKPGITGWAQINGWRGETDTVEKMEKRIEFDLHYINNWTLWFDIRIIILTIFKGFINKNAY